MERKAAIVRFWFFALAVALLGCWEPAWWFGVVPAFFWGGCPCCVTCSCNRCDNSETPCSLEVELIGITNGACGSCTSLNALYVLTYGVAGGCQWSFTLPSAICTITGLEASFGLDGSLDYRMSIRLLIGASSPWTFFKLHGSSDSPEFDPPPVCMAFSSETTTGQAGIGAFGCVRTGAVAVYSAA